MKKSPLMVVLVLSLFTLSLGQQPNASIQQSPAPLPTTSPATTNQVNQLPAASPAPTTGVKISVQGLELTGFPTWIIWVLVGVAAVALVVWILLFRSYRASTASITTAGVLAAVLTIVLVFLLGNWWGKSSARSELEKQAAAKAAIQVQALPDPPEAQSGLSVHTEILAFILILGIEFIFIAFVFYRWGSGYHSNHQQMIERQVKELGEKRLDEVARRIAEEFEWKLQRTESEKRDLDRSIREWVLSRLEIIENQIKTNENELKTNLNDIEERGIRRLDESDKRHNEKAAALSWQMDRLRSWTNTTNNESSGG